MRVNHNRSVSNLLCLFDEAVKALDPLFGGKAQIL